MTIPTNLRVPGVFAEFDPSRAFQGPAILNYQGLLIGQKLAAGTKPEAQVDKITSADQAAEYYGAGSVLHRMAIGWFASNKVTEVYAAALDDAGAGVAATGTIAISGPATADGSLIVYIQGTRIAISVSDTDTATVIGDALEAAITADTSLPVSASNSTGTVTITAKNDGETGNDIDLRINYNEGEVLPAGVSVVITPMASGATNPDIQDIIDILGDEWFQVICAPFTDATNLTAIETELSDRFGPIRMIDGVYFACKTGTLGQLETFGNGRNSPHVSVMDAENVLQTPWEQAAGYAGQVALEGQADPARPFQTLELKNILPPGRTERRTLLENNQLLYDGISTFYTDSGGKVRIQRAITMYQQNAAGAADIAYLDVTTMLTLMYLRYDFRTTIQTKYARAKLADDGTNFGPNQKVITPSIGKAEAIAKFRQWEALGLVENADQFINDLQCYRSETDPNRLVWILPPDLINQFIVGDVTIQFLLQSPST